MKKLLPMLALSFLLLAACGKDDSKNYPACVDTLIDQLRPDLCRGTADLTKWRFKGEEVYCFNYGTCTSDSKAVIYDKDCRKLCSLFGLSGNTICVDTEWDGNAEKLEDIYKF